MSAKSAKPQTCPCGKPRLADKLFCASCWAQYRKLWEAP